MNCSFWFFVGTKNQNEQHKTAVSPNGNQAQRNMYGERYFTHALFNKLTLILVLSLPSDRDECSEPFGNLCDINADCFNLEGAYLCQCKSGYAGDGTYCRGQYLYFRIYG